MMSHKEIEVSLDSHRRPLIKRNNRLRYLIIFVSLYIAVLANNHSLAESNKSGIESNVVKIDSEVQPDVKWIVFSATQHSSTRKMFIKQMHIRKSKLKTGKIYIALGDLNDDGASEVFVYINNYYYCGNEIGCPLYIYKIEDQTLKTLFEPFFHRDGFPIFMNINKKGEQKEIGILLDKTNNWHDLLFSGESVWKWNGNYYKYSNQIKRK